MLKRLVVISVLVCALFGFLLLGTPASAAPATPWPDPEGDEYARYLSAIGRGPLSQPRQVWTYSPQDCSRAARLVVAQDGSLYLLYERQVATETDVRRVCVDRLAKDGTKLWTVELGSGKRTNRTTAGDIALLSDGGAAVVWRCDDPSSNYDYPRVRRLGPDGSTLWEKTVAGFTDGGTQLDLVPVGSCLYVWSGNGYVWPDAYLYRTDTGSGSNYWSVGAGYILRQMLTAPGGNALVIGQDANGRNYLMKISSYPPDYGLYDWRKEADWSRAMTGSDGRIYAGRRDYGYVYVFDSSGTSLASFGGSGMSATAALAQGSDGSVYRIGYSYVGQESGKNVWKAHLQKFSPSPNYTLLWSVELGTFYGPAYNPPPCYTETRVIVDAEGNAFAYDHNTGRLYGVSPSGSLLWTLSPGVPLGMGGDGRLFFGGGSSFYAYNTQDGLPAPSGLTAAETGGYEWHQSAGRGWAVLNWNADSRGATGYRVHVFDGYRHREFDVGAATSWDSRVARIYPSEEQLASYPDNSVTDDIFNRVQGGLDLRDDPRGLYRKTAGTTRDQSTLYYFGVSAYNFWVPYGPMSTELEVQLPDRTDPEPPGGTVGISGNPLFVSSPDVTLEISGTDTGGSGVSGMQFSNDGTVWSSWVPYSTSCSWQLSPSPGEKTVYVRLKDAAGNISQVVSAQTYLKLDWTLPEASVTVNDGAETTSSQSVTLKISASDDTSDAERLEMRFSNDFVNWSSWEPFQPTKSWTLSSGTGAKVVYLQVKDASGNIRTVYDLINYVTSGTYAVSSSSGTAGTVTVNGQPVSTRFVTERRVALSVSAPGATSVQFSYDGVSWSEPEPVYTSRVLNLPEGEGQSEVFVKFNTGPVYTLEFTLDRTPPPVELSWLGNATVTSGGSATLVVTARDNFSSQANLKYSYSTDGGATWTSQAAYSRQVTIPFSGTGYKVVHFRVYDQAGNYAEKAVGIYNP